VKRKMKFDLIPLPLMTQFDRWQGRYGSDEISKPPVSDRLNDRRIENAAVVEEIEEVEEESNHRDRLAEWFGIKTKNHHPDSKKSN